MRFTKKRLHHLGRWQGKFRSAMKTLVGHGADFLLHFRRVHHDDGVPGAAIEKAAVRALAEALLAADAENRIDLYASERRIVLVRNPEHAVFDGTVFDAGG